MKRSLHTHAMNKMTQHYMNKLTQPNNNVQEATQVFSTLANVDNRDNTDFTSIFLDGIAR